jgi:hypothetical protein
MEVESFAILKNLVFPVCGSDQRKLLQSVGKAVFKTRTYNGQPEQALIF